MQDGAPNRVRSHRSGREARVARYASRMPQDTIHDLIELMNKIQAHVGEMRRMVKDMELQGPSEVEAFQVAELVRLRKTGGSVGIVRVTNDDGWVGVDWPHSVTEWVRSDDLERA